MTGCWIHQPLSGDVTAHDQASAERLVVHNAVSVVWRCEGIEEEAG